MEYLRKRLWRGPAQGRSSSSNEGCLAHSQEMEEEEKEEEEKKKEEEFDVIQECVPIHFLENRIRTLSRTSVPYDLRRLAQHMENMTTFQANGEWEKLNTEQINASRTVQQMKGHLQTLDELRQQVRHSELSTFDRLTDAIRENILGAVQDYQACTASLGEEGVAGGVVNSDVGEAKEDVAEDEEEKGLLAVQKQALHYQSLEELRADLLELNDLVKHLNTTASAHSDQVRLLSSRTEQAADRVHDGVGNLRGGQRLKGYMLPVGGAIVGGVLGGVVGGPVGAVAGFQVGALTAATAGTAGVLGGAFIGYRVRKSNAKAARRETANSTPTPPPVPPTVAADSPPPPTASHRKAD